MIKALSVVQIGGQLRQVQEHKGSLLPSVAIPTDLAGLAVFQIVLVGI